MKSEEELLSMARRFIAGDDRSMEFVTSIEKFALEHLIDSEMFEFLTEGLSLYRPWAGSPYWTEEDMLQLMKDFVTEYGHGGS
ncbi:hypothetical protein AB0G64_14220 [Streptomyces longwoodensis]|uniref:hypothetical protein n=1 Tax=Streptomyces longwoodensis TaxID=68231 RepID=UPI0033C5DF2A